MGLFDLDELTSSALNTFLFGYNKPGLFSFQDKDHGDGSGRPLRFQVEQALADQGINPPGGPIRILCMPRLLGYVFNPISIYFCYDITGDIRAIVHEVNNTFGGRHLYPLPACQDDRGRIRQNCDKAFPVSPFLPQDMDYRFTIAPPGEKTAVHIAVYRRSEEVLSAWFSGQRKPFTTAALAREWLRHPAMTFKVIAAIHWEALLLWPKLRGAK